MKIAQESPEWTESDHCMDIYAPTYISQGEVSFH